MRRVVALLVVLLAAMSGCSSSGHRAAPPTTLPDPDVVPAVITPAYVDAVFVVLNHVAGNATRVLVSTRSVTPAVTADLRAIFNDPLFTAQLNSALSAVRSGGLNNVRTSPGDGVTTVTRLLTAGTDCIFVGVSTDYSAMDIRPVSSPAADYYELKPKQSGDDPEHLNTTPWAIVKEEPLSKSGNVPSPCGG